LQKNCENIPVSLIVTIDPAHLMPKLPTNVERYMNIFLARDVLGGGDVEPEKGYQGHFSSFDLSKLKGVLHINIDKMDIIHTQLLTKILQIPETPARLEGEGVPIRYVVPPDAAVDLWDSGMPAVVTACLSGHSRRSIRFRRALRSWRTSALSSRATSFRSSRLPGSHRPSDNCGSMRLFDDRIHRAYR
jgi:hypothetical protein